MKARPTTKHERECLVEIITPREQIRKFFFETHLEFLTSVPQQRLQEMILSSCMKGHSGKMSDYGECGPAHRTTYGHFLAKGKWDDKRLEETQKRESFQTVSELSRRDGTPLFISIDDTVLPKTVHHQRRNVQHRGPDGITPIWRGRSSMGIRSMLPSLGPEILLCVIP